jgi:hypothetical protein
MPALAPSEMGTAWKPADDERAPCMGRARTSDLDRFLEYRFEQARFQEARVIVQEGPLQEQSLHQSDGDPRHQALGASRADGLTARRG